MKNIFRQDGYTLLLTLVLTVLLLLVTATFMMASLNQTKQIIRTDDSFLATSLAEMGTEYYHLSISRMISSEFIDAEKDFIQILDSNSSNQIKINTINDRINAIPYNINQSIILLNSNPQEVIIDDRGNGYKLVNVFFDNTSSEINLRVQGNVIDNSNNSTKEIYATLSVPEINEFTPENNDDSNSSGSNSSFPNVVLPLFNENYISDLPNCNTSSPINLNCSALNTHTYSNTKNAKIYSLLTNIKANGSFENTSMIFSANINQTLPLNGSLKGLSIYANGSAKFNNPLEGDNLTIFSKGNLTLNGINNQNNSKLYSLETLTIHNPISSSQLDIKARKVSLNNINNPSHPVNKSYFNATEEITFTGTIDGKNIVINSPDVVVKGNVNAEVEINAQNLTLYSNVSGSLQATINQKLIAPNKITIGFGSDIYINEIDASSDNTITFEGKNSKRSSKVCINTPTVEGISRLKGTGNTEIHINGAKEKKMPNSSHFNYYSSEDDFNKVCGHVKPEGPTLGLETPEVLPKITDLEITEISYN